MYFHQVDFSFPLATIADNISSIARRDMSFCNSICKTFKIETFFYWQYFNSGDFLLAILLLRRLSNGNTFTLETFFGNTFTLETFYWQYSYPGVYFLVYFLANTMKV